MSDKPVSLTTPPEGYADWLAALKARLHSAQQQATLAVNRELVLLYWQIGRDIICLERTGRCYDLLHVSKRQIMYVRNGTSPTLLSEAFGPS
jgi:hypothetical protein